MAKPIYENANVSTTHTFSQWLNRTNQMIYDMGSVVVTTTLSSQTNTINGGWTVGNAHIEGHLSASTLIASGGLRGGTTDTPGNLVVTSNTIFTTSPLVHVQSNTVNFNVDAQNVRFTGIFNHSNTSRAVTFTSNSFNIAHGPLNVSSNSFFTGANVAITGTYARITSNTEISASSFTAQSNVFINGATTNINSTSISVGSANTQTAFIRARLGLTLTPTGNTVNLGSPTALFGNAHVTQIHANTSLVSGNSTVGGDTTINGNLFVMGTTNLASDAELMLNTSTINTLTVTTDVILNAAARTAGNFIPRVNNVNDFGTAALKYRTMYANNFVGNVSWGSLTDRPTPTLTYTGDVTGSGTMVNIGDATINLTSRVASATETGIVSIEAQSFSGMKTFTSGISAALTGNATTATTLQNARTINGVSFDGSANITLPNRIVRANANSATSYPLAFINDTYENTANASMKDIGVVDKLLYQPSTGTLSSTDFNSSSDERWKTDIQTIEFGLEKVRRMRGVEYDRIDNGKHYVGVIAQEIEEVVPEVVHTDEDGYKYVSYGNLVGVLIEAVKELSAKVETLENQIKDNK